MSESINGIWDDAIFVNIARFLYVQTSSVCAL